MTDASPAPSRRIGVDEIPPGGRDMAFALSPAECAELALRLKVPALCSLHAEFALTRRGGIVAVAGNVTGRVVQTCVASLEPFESEISEPIAVRFAVEPDAAAQAGDSHDPDAEDPPEPLIGGAIDLGSVAAEFFALGLDPYPKKPGATFPGYFEAAGSASPFAGLGDLLKSRGRG